MNATMIISLIKKKLFCYAIFAALQYMFQDYTTTKSRSFMLKLTIKARNLLDNYNYNLHTSATVLYMFIGN